jgi:hypothetical protein
MASPELRGESFRGLLIQACKDKDKLFALQAMLDDLDTFLYGRAQEKNLQTLKEKARKLARSV